MKASQARPDCHLRGSPVTKLPQFSAALVGALAQAGVCHWDCVLAFDEWMELEHLRWWTCAFCARRF